MNANNVTKCKAIRLALSDDSISITHNQSIKSCQCREIPTWKLLPRCNRFPVVKRNCPSFILPLLLISFGCITLRSTIQNAQRISNAVIEMVGFNSDYRVGFHLLLIFLCSFFAPFFPSFG